MLTATAIVVSALAVSASAIPFPGTYNARVAFPGRQGLTTRSGHYDGERAKVQVVKDINKHRRNLINIKRNLGDDALKEGAHILPAASYTPLVHKRQAVNLTDQGGDSYWSGNISIGTPGQTFVIDFDTGSSDLWVTSTNCTSDLCSGKDEYDPSESSTAVLQDGTFEIDYADASTVSGPIWTDTVSVGGINVTNQYFSPVYSISSQFEEEAIDGILGLGLPAASNIQQAPFFYSAKDQGAVQTGVFGFKLAQNGSELYLGGTNTSLYNGSIEYHSVTGSSYWELPAATIFVNSSSIASNQSTIIDSGTTIIYGPSAQVEELYAAIPGSVLYDSEYQMYAVPCDTIPAVAFNWGGANFTISAENFNLGTSEGEPLCVGAISGRDLGLGDDTWLLGDSFMKNVYSAFSIDDSAIGFAPLL